MKRIAIWATCLGIACASSTVLAATELVIATVNNGHMIEMQRLGRFFEQANPDIKLKWVTLEEGVLRQRVTTDIATGGGQFDLMTIGMYETPLWARKNWLLPFKPDAGYDVDDLLPTIREGLSHKGTLYAAPFYGESSMIMYRSDLVQKAGMRIPDRPTWDHLRSVAAKIHDPAKGVYGICLRGKPGWGDNMSLITTMANSYGGQLFDMNWKPQFTSKPWMDALGMYVDLMKNYGPPGSASNSFNEILAMFNQGKCGIWIDASIAASFISDPKQSKVADKVAFAQSPVAVTDRGANWLMAWSLAIPRSSRKPEAAQKFVNWATSKEYVRLVARESGWNKVPTGTRKSTYNNPAFLKVAKFAEAEAKAISTSSPNNNTLPKSPYVGVQFAVIPEFQIIGVIAGQQFASALLGKLSVERALTISQHAADRQMRKARYYR